jgi:BASS family bile acid:Na+ symporter
MVEGVVLPIILALIMVGVGLGLNPRGLVVESIRPKPLLLALSGLLVAMPLAGLAAASLFRGDEGLRIGLMLLVMSPVGLLAAPLTGCRRGNVPVALSLTLITGLIYVAAAPFLVRAIVSAASPSEHIIHLPAEVVFGKILSITLLPLAIGWLLNALLPAATPRLSVWLPRFTMPLLLAVLGWIIWESRGVLVQAPFRLLVSILLINGASLACAAALAALGKCDRPDRVTLATTFMIRQEGAGLFVAVTLLHEPAAAIPLIINIVVSQIAYMASEGMKLEQFNAAAAVTLRGIVNRRNAPKAR